MILIKIPYNRTQARDILIKTEELIQCSQHDLTETLEHFGALKKAWVSKLCTKPMCFLHIWKLHFWPKAALHLKSYIFCFYSTALFPPWKCTKKGSSLWKGTQEAWGKRLESASEREDKCEMEDVGYQNWTWNGESQMPLNFPELRTVNLTLQQNWNVLVYQHTYIECSI